MSVATSSDGSSNASSTIPIVVSTKNDRSTTLFSDLPEPSGRTLFISSIRDEVNMEVNEYLKENGIGGRKHAGLPQNRFKERWNTLLLEDQRKWNDQATTLTASKPSTIYQNQEQLNTDLTSVLYHLRGPDAHQVGNAAFLILYVVRNEDKCLQTTSIVISPDDTIPFDNINEGQIPWDNVIVNQSKYIKTPLPSAMQLKKASELEFGDVFTLTLYFSQNPNITLFQTITTSPLPVPLSPSKPLAPSPKNATSAKPLPSKSQSPNRRLASPWNGGSPATGHEEINWLKCMRPQRDPTPDPTIAELSKNPTKTPNEKFVPLIAEELIIVEKLIIMERLATPLGEGICLPPESPLLPVPQEISNVPPVKPPVKVAAKVKRAQDLPKKVTEAGTETSKDAEESKKQKSPVSSHLKEPATNHIKPNAELPIPPRHSTRQKEMVKPKEPSSKTVNYTQCKGARGWVYVEE
ncbi:hypothetical protein EDD85DRAFT_954365 [Armillaria nabsnona]|nr:hypothetical protein EDD85DRAFT_954365 [Armillaria nabsnona]